MPTACLELNHSETEKDTITLNNLDNHSGCNMILLHNYLIGDKPIKLCIYANRLGNS